MTTKFLIVATMWFWVQALAYIVAFYLNKDRIHQDNPVIDHVYLTVSIVLGCFGMLCLLL